MQNTTHNVLVQFEPLGEESLLLAYLQIENNEEKKGKM